MSTNTAPTTSTPITAPTPEPVPAGITLSSPAQAALMVLVQLHDRPRAVLAGMVIASSWHSATGTAIVKSSTMVKRSGRSAPSAARLKNRADANDQGDSKRSRIFEEAGAGSEGTTYRLTGHGEELWAEHGGRLLRAIEGHRVVTSLPLLEEWVEGRKDTSGAAQDALDKAFGITDLDIAYWEERIERDGYEAAAAAAGVKGEMAERLFSSGLTYGSPTDHSMTGYVASQMDANGAVAADLAEQAHYAGIKNVRWVPAKTKKVAAAGVWNSEGGSLTGYTGRGLALRAAWGSWQRHEVAVDA